MLRSRVPLVARLLALIVLIGGCGDDSPSVALDGGGADAEMGADAARDASTSDRDDTLDADSDASSDAGEVLPGPRTIIVGGIGTDAVRDLAVDDAGNIVVVGSFEASVDFGDGERASLGASDAFVARYAVDGALSWVRTFGGSEVDVGAGVALDGSGNVYVVGEFGGTVDFGEGARESVEGKDIFVVSYDSGGALRWSRTYGGIGQDVARRVRADATGNLVVVGHFRDTIDLGEGEVAAAGASDAFVAAYGADGAVRFTRTLGGASFEEGADAAILSDGSVLVTGWFLDQTELGREMLTGQGGQDVFIAHLTVTGMDDWAVGYGGAGNEQPSALAVDANGAFAITGFFEQTASFGTGDLMSAGSRDVFVAAFASEGMPSWSVGLGGSAFDGATGLAYGTTGEILVAGEMVGTLDFGLGPLEARGTDIFLVRLGSGGGVLDARLVGGTKSDAGGRPVFSLSGRLVLGGVFEDMTDLGQGEIVSAGGVDGFVVEYEAP